MTTIYQDVTHGISILPIEPSFSNSSNVSANDVGMNELLLVILFSTLSITGIIGNVLVITVVLRVRGMKTPTNCYLVSLAASDTLFFLASMPHEVMYLLAPTDNYVFGTIGCSLLTYLPYLAMNTSSLSITAFTIERFIGICYPYRARTMCTVKRARLIILILWIASIIYHSQWFFLAAVVKDDLGTFCSFRLKRNDTSYKIVFLADFLLLYVVPMLLDIVIYVKIGFTLRSCGEKIKKKEKRVKEEHLLGSAQKSSNDDSVKYGHYSGRDSHISGKANLSKSRNQVVKMLALVLAVFATCWLPYRGMVMYNSFVNDPKYYWSPDWFINFSKTLIFVNCAINPILYNVMSARFRSAFKSLLTRKTANSYQQNFNSRFRPHTDLMSRDSPSGINKSN